MNVSYRPIRLTSPAGIFTFLVFVFFLSVSAYSHTVPLKYDLTVRFAMEESLLQGEASFNLPEGHGMKLLVAGLDDLWVRINGDVLENSADDEGILSIPTGDAVRKVTLSWRKKVEGERGTMIGENGIALLGPWYPRPAAEAEYSLKALIPQDFEAVSEADRIITKQQGDRKLVSFHFPHPVSYIHFIAGPYEVVEEEFGDGKVLASYFFKEDRDLAAGYREKTRQYLKRYTEFFGEYPYGRFAVVENRWPTGFAMPTFTLLGQQVARLPFIVDTSLGHEVLHSWFGNAVNVDPGQGNWVEGLTTYLADQAYAEDAGEGADFRKNQLVKYQSYVADNSTLTVQEFSSPGGHGIADQASRAVGYNKCSMIFHMLRRLVGEDNFKEALRSFYRNNRYGRAGWQEIEEAFGEVTDQDLSAFFKQWLTRSDVPELKIENLEFQESDGDPLLAFDLVQENDEPYDLQVPVLVEAGGETVSRRVRINENKVSVTFELADYPARLMIDPEYDLMRLLSGNELPPVWSAFQGARDKLVIVENGKEELYGPMMAMAEELGAVVVEDRDLDDSRLEDSSLLFLGEDSDACRSIFGDVDLAGSGFSLEVRKNPLNLEEVAVVVEASSLKEVEAVAGKLRHYGKYGILHFTGGKNVKKIVPESDQGIIRNLDRTPSGVAINERRDFRALMAEIAENRVVYVGETHVRVADHQLQMRIVRAMHERHPSLAIGMEMFPARVQDILDKYIRSEIDEREFLREVEYFQNWGYDYRFYQDIMQYARKNSIPVIGLNLDKKIVSNTFRQGGIAALDEEVKAELPRSRDLSMEGYRERLGEVFQQHQGPHFGDGMMSGFVQAQALWDETMARTIADYLRENPDRRMVVLAGSGHVNKRTGIPPRVSRRLEVTQAVAVNAKGGEKLHEDDGDYLFFTPPFGMEQSPLLGVRLTSKDERMVVAGFSHGHSPASLAGLKEKDVILSLDGQEIKSLEDIKIVLLYKNKGDTVTVKVRRPVFLFPDSVKEIEVTL